MPLPVYADRMNNIWMGNNRYFVRYNIATKQFTKFEYPASAVSYDYDFLQYIYEDNGFLWLGSTNGLFEFNTGKEKWDYSYAHNPGNSH